LISVKAGLGWIRCIAKINLDLFCQTAFNHTSAAIIPSTHTQIYIHIYLQNYLTSSASLVCLIR